MLKKKIFTPGPTQVHPEVLKEVISNFTYHRSSEFRAFHKNLLPKLKKIFFTDFHLNVLTTSGTGAMEAAVSNFCRPGDRILFLNQGKFGSRWGSICKAFGISAEEIKVQYGKSANAADLKQADLNKFSAVFLTHSETSTATLTDIKSLASCIKNNSNSLVVADAISSIGTIDFKMDEWNIDVAVSASQKGFMSPPGISVIAYNDIAYERMINSSSPRFFFDLRKESEAQKTFSTSWTPAIGIMYGLDKACDLILEEGIEKRWEKVHQMAKYFRNEAMAIGFGIFSENPTDSLTALTFPDDIPSGKLVNSLKEKYGVQIANGQADIGLKDKIARISHMGDINMEDIQEFLKIIKLELNILRG